MTDAERERLAALVEQAQHYPMGPMWSDGSTAREIALVTLLNEIQPHIPSLLADSAALAQAERERDEFENELMGWREDPKRYAAKQMNHERGLLASCRRLQERTRDGVAAIYQAARGDKKGEAWTLRKWMDGEGLFNDDIGGTDRLIEVATSHLLAILLPVEQNTTKENQ